MTHSSSPSVDIVESTVAPIVGDWDIEWKALASTATVDMQDNTGYRDDLIKVYQINGTEVTITRLM